MKATLLLGLAIFTDLLQKDVAKEALVELFCCCYCRWIRESARLEEFPVRCRSRWGSITCRPCAKCKLKDSLNIDLRHIRSTP